jgi:hypothetical protein
LGGNISLAVTRKACQNHHGGSPFGMHFRFRSWPAENDVSPARRLHKIQDTSEQPPVIVTAYRTSKIEKYWSGE